MHPNPVFRAASTTKALSVAAEVGFGVLAINGQDGPILSHVPFLISGNSARLHLVRSNPIARETTEPIRAKLAVTGPHSYVSPDWYGAEDQVPTWNYVAVHLVGKLQPLPQDGLLGLLDDLSEEFETRLLPKPIWRSGKMDRDALERMLRVIQPFELQIEDVQSTFKLGQNKPEAARRSAALEVADSGIGSEVRQLAALMQSIHHEELI